MLIVCRASPELRVRFFEGYYYKFLNATLTISQRDKQRIFATLITTGAFSTQTQLGVRSKRKPPLFIGSAVGYDYLCD